MSEPSQAETDKKYLPQTVRLPRILSKPLVEEVLRRNSMGGMPVSASGIMREALQEWLASRGLLK